MSQAEETGVGQSEAVAGSQEFAAGGAGRDTEPNHAAPGGAGRDTEPNHAAPGGAGRDTEPNHAAPGGIDWGAAGRDKRLGGRMIALAYALGLAVAVLVALAMEGSHPLAVAAAADVAATVAVFAFSFAFRNSSFYDAYWSVAPPVIASYFLGASLAGAAPLRQALAIALVGAWALRLTWNWWRGWTGLEHEDWRYRDLQVQTGGAYWLVSFTGIHLFPTLQVFLGCLALWPAIAAGTRPFGLLDVVAAGVTGGAILLEAVADRQLHRFKQSAPPRDAVLDSGLWSWSRHPNYLGEIGFWWGLWLFGVAADPGAWWWTLAGPLAITVMFQLASLRMIEQRMLERRPGYTDVMQRVPKLFPWPRLN